MHIKSFELMGLRRLHLNETFNGRLNNVKAAQRYQAARINLFVGPNGGGKSTVLDMVRAVKDYSSLMLLPRENATNDTLSRSFLQFKDFATEIEFKPEGGKSIGVSFKLWTEKGWSVFNDSVTRTSASAPEALFNIMQAVPARISWRTSHDETGAPIIDVIEALNRDARHLIGLVWSPIHSEQTIYSKPLANRLDLRAIRLRDDGHLSIDLNDDIMPNTIPIPMLPSGWRAYGGLLAWLRSKKDAICVIEEPETHLHPMLQRLLIERISEIAEENRLQLFISTHSSVFTDIATWPGQHTRLFEANGFALTELTDPALAMSGLGVRPSDVFQANGVVWVEGASDRVYLLHWLKLWCAHHNKTMPVENLDFSFSFYGGSMLGHFSAGRSGLIDMFRVNQNSIVIMDRDLDFERLNGVEQCVTPNCTKYHVWQDFVHTPKPHCYCWITENYTIESYLPPSFRNQYFALAQNGRLDKHSGYSKVAIADRFVTSQAAFPSSYETSSDLPGNIEKLFNSISAWNA